MNALSHVNPTSVISTITREQSMNDHVAAILASRQQQVTKLEKKKVELSQLQKVARELGINTIDQAYAELSQSLQVITDRFNRKALTIAVAGYARIGKSKVLQSMTGLGDMAIPVSDGDHCTGSPSRISHVDGLEQPYAEIFCYTEQELLQEKIWPYFELITLEKPDTFDGFLQMELLNSLSNSLFSLEQLKHLRNYQSFANKYRHLLSGQTLRQEGDAIVEYVAQYHPEDKEKKYYNYLAVKEVCIYCSFPFQHMHSIQLLDMPGLGDTQVGSLETLLTRVGSEADVLLYLRRPNVNVSGDSWMSYEVDFYSAVDDILPALPLKHWGCLMLNHFASEDHKTDNLLSCQRMKKAAEEHVVLDFAQIFIADGSDPKQVRKAVLQPSVEHLVNQVEQLDAYLIQSVDAQVSSLVADLTAAVKNLHSGVSEDADRIYEDAFKAFWNQLTRLLNDKLLGQYEKQRYEVNQVFERDLMLVFECLSRAECLPTVEQVQDDYYGKSISFRNSFNSYLDQVRVNITSGFQSLDNGLGNVISGLKGDVANHLQQTALAKLAPDLKGEAFLSYLLSLLEGDKGHQLLPQAFADLLNYRLAYRGMVQHRIRACLDDLHCDVDIWSLSEDELDAENVCLRLRQAFDTKVAEIRNALDSSILQEPNLANYAVCEEFVDRLVRSDLAERDWRILLRKHQQALWPDVFAEHALIQELHQCLRVLVK